MKGVGNLNEREGWEMRERARAAITDEQIHKLVMRADLLRYTFDHITTATDPRLPDEVRIAAAQALADREDLYDSFVLIREIFRSISNGLTDNPA